jgi:hypothetical protein
MLYNTQFKIGLVPHGTPCINYGLDGVAANNGLTISEPCELSFDVDLAGGAHEFYIDFYNKTNATPEQAVEIAWVEFEGLRLDRFKWSSSYRPVYPEPWASQQTEVLPEVHTSMTYLGWNGRWTLHFETPIFTWIHQLEHLGWIYT